MKPRAGLSVIAALALLAPAGATATDESLKAGDFRKCGKYDLGFTNAKVKAKKMKCKAAKEVFRAWEEKVNCPDNPCEVVNVASFRCVQSGSDVRVSLRCTDRNSRAAMKAHWGG